ncbi:NUDIX hydrolase [Rhizobium sophoriradicis]|uniref:DNA mismatch repair protein MutT n=1 Tax=Rhizobium sophoriradicis TaxID=1535245 RepID=A0A2A5KPI4_9HYPH|nr:NUDIX hydrolase [Rhizobium sophoriradicis]PCK78954.1 DNA mismatch repair protein MutT [Rhizobium sophoriradicis]UWU35450.1 NUDIX hydrolase [Rhizobium leguminosarum bv. phaseoli]
MDRLIHIAAGGIRLLLHGHAQAAALCVRKTKNGREVLLLSNRSGARWGIPKGNIDIGETSSKAAARESYEEAGVRGHVSDEVLGTFTYRKPGRSWPYHVTVHALEVSEVDDDFPESAERRRKWVSLAEAARHVHEPGLRDVLHRLRSHPRKQYLA